MAVGHVLHRAAVILAGKGGTVADTTIGDVLELLDTEPIVNRTPMADGTAFYRMLRQMGVFGAEAPSRLRALRSAGQRTPEELIDRYHLACRPVRDLLVDWAWRKTSHHSLIQYRLPTTGELVPLLQIAPSKTDTERLLVVSPELAEVLSTIIRRQLRKRLSSPAFSYRCVRR